MQNFEKKNLQKFYLGDITKIIRNEKFEYLSTRTENISLKDKYEHRNIELHLFVIEVSCKFLFLSK